MLELAINQDNEVLRTFCLPAMLISSPVKDTTVLVRAVCMDMSPLKSLASVLLDDRFDCRKNELVGLCRLSSEIDSTICNG